MPALCAALLVCDLLTARIIDGDTFTAFTTSHLSPSVTVQEETRYRLLRVDTPERGEPGFDTATQALTDLIARKRVAIQTLPQRIRDSFGRPLVEIYTCDGDERTNVNDRLIEMGWGTE